MAANTELVATIARAQYVERCHLESSDLREINGCPGLAWEQEDDNWYKMSATQKKPWLDAAEVWLVDLEVKNNLAYTYLINNWREVDVFPVE